MTEAKRCAVLGSPIAHSLSPAIHRAAYELLGLSGWRYDAFDVDADGLAGFIAGCGPEWVGLSCTMPLKERLLDLGRPTDLAALLRSGNTFLFGRAGAEARVENTDVAGIVGPLRAVGLASVSNAVIVGAGATARSGLAALAQLGLSEALVLARDAGRARDSLGDLADALGVRVVFGGLERPAVGEYDVLLSVLPVAVDRALADALVPGASVVFDVRYGHGPSSYADAAEAFDVQVIDGIEMLAAQAAVQVRLMTGHDCPVEPLADAARAELTRRNSR